MKNTLTWHSPLAWTRIVAGLEGVRLVEFHSQKELLPAESSPESDSPFIDATQLLQEAARQIDAYLAGRVTGFDLPLEFAGQSAFSRKVLLALMEVPYGTNVSYGELSRMAGAAGAARAVGRVMASNPLPIIVPCHRVIPSSGGIGGYSGGEGSICKQWLLELEGATAAGFSGNADSAYR
ncbi:MAG: methylated-DNA--[protein]-cysteine S-methyltransferase [Desulfuromonadales bacterium]